MPNVISIVSLGPGDPELITLKGLNALQWADCIFCPATVLPESVMISRSKDILVELGIDETKITLFGVPMSENRTHAIREYHDVAMQIEERQYAGCRIAVVAEGDAGFYSSSYYISEMLTAKGLPVERIAGVPAFIACAASQNICISKQKEETLIITHFSSVEDLREKVASGRTLVVMKASAFESVIKDFLSIAGEDTQFHYFENSGISGKAFYTNRKSDICGRHFPYFSLLIIRSDQELKELSLTTLVSSQG